MLHTGMTTLACILSKLFPLDCVSCNALYFEYLQEYFHETIQFCRRGHDIVLCIQNMAAHMFIPSVVNQIRSLAMAETVGISRDREIIIQIQT